MTPEQFLSVIKNYTQEHQITSKQIEERYKIPGTVVRDLVRELRRRGEPICNCYYKDGQRYSNGYFYAQNINQLQPTIDDMRSRAASINQTASRMESAFSGQLSIF